MNESKTMMVELNVGFSMGECRNLVMTSTDHDASLTYGHRKIGVPRRTGACKRALFVHAYERAELATAAVIHVLHFHVIYHVMIPLIYFGPMLLD